MGKWKTRLSEIFFVVCAVLLLSSLATPFSEAKGIPVIGSDQLDLPEVTTPSQTNLDTGGLFQNNDGISILLYLVDRVLGIALLFLQVGVVIYLIIEGAQIMMNLDNKDMLKEKQMSLLYALIGVVVLSIGGEVVRVFNPINVATSGQSGLFLTGNEGLGGVVMLIVTIIKYALWAVAVVMIVNIGYKMISSPDKEISSQKRNLMWTAVGLFIVQISELIIRPFAASTQDKVQAGNELINNINGLLLSVMGPVALFFVILGAFYMLTANGDESRIARAKKIFIGVAIAIVVAFSAYTLVSEILRYAPAFTG